MITTSEQIGILETGRKRALVSWGSIFAGWLLGNAVMLLMMNFGSAIGLSAIDVNNPEAVSKGIAIGSAVWVLFTWAVSFFLSGFVAAWLSGNVDRAVGAVHGMTVWAMAVAFTALVGAAGLLGAATLGTGAAVAGVTAAAKSADDVDSGVQAALKDQIGQAAASTGAVSAPQARQAVEQVDAKTLAAASASLLKGDAEGAKNQIAIHTNLSRPQIDGVISAMQAKTEEAKARAKDAADKAANYTAAAMWLTFFAGVFSLIAAALGGSAGSNRLVTTYRRFDRI